LAGTPVRLNKYPKTASGFVKNRIDIKHRNLFITAGIAGVQRPVTLLAIHAKGIENLWLSYCFQVLLLQK
jgi:hypothetical protein